MRPTRELDAGPLCLQRAEAIRPDDDYGALAGRLALLGGELLVEALGTRPVCHQQPAEGATYADKIQPDERRLDPERRPDELERRVRALTPHVGAYVELPSDGRLGVLRAGLGRADELRPGELAARDGRLLYGATSGSLELLEVQPEGKRAMAAADWIRGHRDLLAEAGKPTDSTTPAHPDRGINHPGDFPRPRGYGSRGMHLAHDRETRPGPDCPACGEP